MFPTPRARARCTWRRVTVRSWPYGRCSRRERLQPPQMPTARVGSLGLQPTCSWPCACVRVRRSLVCSAPRVSTYQPTVFAYSCPSDCAPYFPLVYTRYLTRRISTPLVAAALHTAAAEGQLEAVLTLLEAGAAVSAAGGRGMTPLHLAAALGKLPVLRALIESGADLGAIDSDNSTALHLAARQGQLPAVNTLLDARASPCARGLLEPSCNPSRTRLEPFHLSPRASLHHLGLICCAVGPFCCT